MKKLWVVSKEAEVVVVAETREDAEREARKVGVSDWNADYNAGVMTSKPWGWEGDEYPYGDDEDKTVTEWIEAGAAPEYVAMQERTKRARQLSPCASNGAEGEK